MLRKPEFSVFVAGVVAMNLLLCQERVSSLGPSEKLIWLKELPGMQSGWSYVYGWPTISGVAYGYDYWTWSYWIWNLPGVLANGAFDIVVTLSVFFTMEKIRKIRSVFQVSLRTIFVLMTSVAITAAAAGWSTTECNRFLSTFGLVRTYRVHSDQAPFIYIGLACFVFAFSSCIVSITSIVLAVVTTRLSHQMIRMYTT